MPTFSTSGLWATPERQLSFDLRDFDETLPGPFEWDLLRLAASLHVLARRSRGDDATARRRRRARRARRLPHPHAPVCRRTVPRHLVRPDHADDLIDVAVPEERGGQRSVGRQAGQEAHQHRRRQEVHSRSSTGADASSRRHRSAVRMTNGRSEPSIEVFAAYRASLPEERRYLLDRYALVDVVRQVVGVGSVGMRVYLLLLRAATPRSALPADQAGRTIGVRGDLEPSSHRTMASGSARPALHPELHRHLRGLDHVEGIDFYVRQFRDMKVIPSASK